jgi:hypothetical protein
MGNYLDDRTGVAKERARFKENYNILTKKDYNKLSNNEKKLYDLAKENKNIIAAKKLKGTLIPKKLKERGFGRLKIFDSESYEGIKKPIFLGKKKAIERMQKDINKAETRHKRKKSFLTDVGIHGPLPKPLTKAQQEALSAIISSGKYENPLKSKEAQEILNKNKGGNISKKRTGHTDFRKGGMVYKNG